MSLRLCLLVTTLLLGACAHTPPDDPSDPLERVNRAVFKFNRSADRYVLRPVAQGYDQVLPDPAKRGVSNFFNNLEEPRTVVNSLLQLKLRRAARSTGRFLLNSTAGIAGFMDVATDAGLKRYDEDFGQTLGRYGVGPGWYLMIPFLGPRSNRDLVGTGGDYFTGPGPYVETEVSTSLTATDLVDTRARLLSADSLLDSALDPYIFVRTAYLQQRLSKVYDGNPPRELMYGDYDDSDDPPDPAP